VTARITEEGVRVATVRPGIASVAEFAEPREDRFVDVVEGSADVSTVSRAVPRERLRELGVNVPGTLSLGSLDDVDDAVSVGPTARLAAV
jgi:hypothetical protein